METLSLPCASCGEVGDPTGKLAERPHVRFVVRDPPKGGMQVTICGMCGHTTKLLL